MPTQIPVHQPSQEEYEENQPPIEHACLSSKKKRPQEALVKASATAEEAGAGLLASTAKPPSQQGRKEGVLSLPIVYIQGAVHLLTCVSRCLQGG